MAKTKPQYTIILKVLAKEKFLYFKYKSGIQKLLEAKARFEETNPEQAAFLKHFLKSGLIPNEQLFSPKFGIELLSTQDPFNDIWHVKVEPKTITADLKDCPIFGKNATKLIKKEDRT